MDWKGLLNWSLNYSDGTVNKILKPLSEDDRQFLEAAFESVCMNEMKEIWKILDKLKLPEGTTDEEIEERCNLLENLLILIDGPENARNIVRGKRFNELVTYFFNTQNKEIKLCLASILASMMQNDGYIQNEAINLGMFKVLQLINISDDPDLLGKYIYMLTGLLYGFQREPKQIFLEELDGVKLLYNLFIKNRSNHRSLKRILGIIKELTKTEESVSKCADIKGICIGKIKEIDFHLRLTEFLAECEYNSHDDVDIIRTLLEINVNTLSLFPSADQLHETITVLRHKLNITQTTLLTEEDKKEEHAFLDSIAERVTTLTKSQDATLDNPTPYQGYLEENVNYKDSIHIEIKK